MKVGPITIPTFFTRTFHWIFEAGTLLKGFDAALEILGGFIFLFASNIKLNQLIVSLTQHELSEDPHDKVAILLRHSVSQLTTDARVFGSVYLIVHGLTKLWLVTGLLRGRLWAYPATIGFLCLFIAYQLYRLSYSYSIGLMLLTSFDLIFALLVWREYQSSRHP